MKYTFEYSIETNDPSVVCMNVECEEDITADQAERMKASCRSGKYYFLNEDESIQDIYEMIYEEAAQNIEEENEEDPEGYTRKVVDFRYPKELR